LLKYIVAISNWWGLGTNQPVLGEDRLENDAQP